MPILDKEQGLHPIDLLDGFSERQEHSERQWWAVYTKPRQEKAVARQLLGQDTPFFLPVTATNHYHRGRRRTAYKPVFASYLFAFGTDYERIDALTSNRILQTLPVEDCQQLVHDLRNLRLFLDAGKPVTIETLLAPGKPIRIKSGPFCGVEGIILRRNGATRLLVSVSYFQQGASVEIDDFMVEPI